MAIQMREHPTREEWAARQANLPEPAKQALRDIAERAERDRTESERLAFAQAAEADEWRGKFEAAVAAALVAHGCEWLAAYRVPDHECAGLPDFRGSSTEFFALFDPSAIGCWPVAVRMVAGTGLAREWSLHPLGWKVYRPSGALTYREWLTAFAFATTHTTPF